MAMYYDPEYDCMVDTSEIEKQYEWFSNQPWFHKTYEEFLQDNFIDIPLMELNEKDSELEVL